MTLGPIEQIEITVVLGVAVLFILTVSLWLKTRRLGR